MPIRVSHHRRYRQCQDSDFRVVGQALARRSRLTGRIRLSRDDGIPVAIIPRIGTIGLVPALGCRCKSSNFGILLCRLRCRDARGDGTCYNEKPFPFLVLAVCVIMNKKRDEISSQETPTNNKTKTTNTNNKTTKQHNKHLSESLQQRVSPSCLRCPGTCLSPMF
jgi:hypothetical protein